MLCCAVVREAGTIEVELEQLKGSVMALTVAANSSAEGETYRELADALLRVSVELLQVPHLLAGAGAVARQGKLCGRPGSA